MSATMDRIATAPYESVDAPPSSPVVFEGAFVNGSLWRRLKSGLWQMLRDGQWVARVAPYSSQEDCIDALVARVAELESGSLGGGLPLSGADRKPHPTLLNGRQNPGQRSARPVDSGAPWVAGTTECGNGSDRPTTERTA